MRIREDFTVGHPAADVWSLLSSAEGAACLPGFDLDTPGTVSFNVDARRLVFDGTASTAADERARTVTVDAKGVERSGLGRARITLMMRVADDGLFSSVQLEAEVSLTGELSSMARLIAEAAYPLSDEFAERLEICLGIGSRPPAPAPQAGAGADAEPEEAHGWLGRLLGRIRRS